jgi:hypothetical protein
LRAGELLDGLAVARYTRAMFPLILLALAPSGWLGGIMP